MTDLEGGITILESSGDNQNWVPTPDNVDTSNFTAGTDLFHLPTFKIDNPWKTDISMSAYPGNFQIATPLGKNEETITLSGYIADIATLKLLKQFVQQHDNISDNQLYLVARFAASSYWTFGDSDRVQRDYVPGWISDIKPSYDANEREILVTLVFQVTWS